jgi:glutaredoxin
MSEPRITLYSARRCPHCARVRQYLQKKGLRFQEFDVDTSPRAQKVLARLGARGVPVVLVGDERIDGFDRRRLDALT